MGETQLRTWTTMTYCSFALARDQQCTFLNVFGFTSPSTVNPTSASIVLIAVLLLSGSAAGVTNASAAGKKHRDITRPTTLVMYSQNTANLDKEHNFKLLPLQQESHAIAKKGDRAMRPITYRVL